jgi:hypothetical protein
MDTISSSFLATRVTHKDWVIAMAANSFRRIALARGLLPSAAAPPPAYAGEPAPKGDDALSDLIRGIRMCTNKLGAGSAMRGSFGGYGSGVRPRCATIHA